jgi:hypothetical protein
VNFIKEGVLDHPSKVKLSLVEDVFRPPLSGRVRVDPELSLDNGIRLPRYIFIPSW